MRNYPKIIWISIKLIIAKRQRNHLRKLDAKAKVELIAARANLYKYKNYRLLKWYE